jgi:head-tail adaptor
MERYIRIQRPAGSRGDVKQWQTVPGADRVAVWETSRADGANGQKLLIFHIAFLAGIEAGCRVHYLGEDFEIVSVSDSPKLRGLELQCRAGSQAQQQPSAAPADSSLS